MHPFPGPPLHPALCAVIAPVGVFLLLFGVAVALEWLFASDRRLEARADDEDDRHVSEFWE
jgi:hypothetical protein